MRVPLTEGSRVPRGPEGFYTVDKKREREREGEREKEQRKPITATPSYKNKRKTYNGKHTTVELFIESTKATYKHKIHAQKHNIETERDQTREKITATSPTHSPSTLLLAAATPPLRNPTPAGGLGVLQSLHPRTISLASAAAAVPQSGGLWRRGGEEEEDEEESV